MEYLTLIVVIMCLSFSFYCWYRIGKEAGKREANEEKAIEVIKYDGKEALLISERYFNQEQARQIAEAFKKDKPVIYKPSR